MSYEPTNWKTGDVVTSAKLNKLENGVANGAGFLKVTSSYDDQTQVYTMDKTWQEIYNALTSGGYVSLLYLDPKTPIVYQAHVIYADYVAPLIPGNGHYTVIVNILPGTIGDASAEENRKYTCAAVNDYPQYHDE